ncbi:hypothetical protein ACFQ07_24950, partial [Actinomadura adrarensis]
GVTHWRLTAQRVLRGARTDFTFTRVDGPTQNVTVELEGFHFHASREHNRIATNAAQRTRLRGDGEIVFQITRADVDLFEQHLDQATPVWPPYQGTAQEQAKAAYEEYGGQRAQFAPAVFANPIDTLIAYLRDPDPRRWARRAQALVTGLTQHPATALVLSTSNPRELATALRAQLGAWSAGEHPVSPAGSDRAGSGHLHLFRTADESGLPILFVLDHADPEELKWTALAVLDDAEAVLETDEHRRRWRAWLYWTNLTQFLSLAGGDGVQLAASRAADFKVEVLAVCGGVGELDSLNGTGPVDRPVTPSPKRPAAPEAVLEGKLRDSAWDEDILDILRDEPDEPDLLALAERLADQGKRAPVFGYELGEGRWLADLAWHTPTLKIAVVPSISISLQY